MVYHGKRVICFIRIKRYVVSGKCGHMLFWGKRALCIKGNWGKRACCIRGNGSCIGVKGNYVVSGESSHKLYQGKLALCCIMGKRSYVASCQKGIIRGRCHMLYQGKRALHYQGKGVMYWAKGLYIVSGQNGILHYQGKRDIL